MRKNKIVFILFLVILSFSQSIYTQEIMSIKGDDSSTLPVELVYFIGNQIANDVFLEWETATELQNYGFNVQRRYSDNAWETLTFIPGHGTSYSPKYYSYLDITIGELVVQDSIFYRLEQIDTDGKIEHPDSLKIDFITAINTELEIQPANFKLEQNYPNPFNPSTAIQYFIPKSQEIKLAVYDLLGNEISILFDDYRSYGEHFIEFFPNENISSGIYIYRLITEKQTFSKKMILLR